MKNKKPKIDITTGMRAMKTIKLTVTDGDGAILDTAEIEVAFDCGKITVRAIEGTLAERPEEQVLYIGK